MAPYPDLPARARTLLDFWFGAPEDPLREHHREVWFKSTPEFDAAVRENFLADYEAAGAAALATWEETPLGALALVLLLDQVPRNAFRGTPQAYRTDPAARAAADRALTRGFDQSVPPRWRIFFYLPFVHSEDIADQRRALALAAALPPDPDHPQAGRHGHRHHDVVLRFGRFPHRNAILGRQSTPEELAYLAEPDSAHWARYYRRSTESEDGER
jgi:uncharacterized protein (DUF924 family)